ncbi:hypothetical protein ACFV9D_24365 [Streptomyces sp. NPDC059875]|uniref:hypothetical protein n=1 Tax=unclassified Streptomyces TaxID=2593676 RepID=UPI00365979DD
MDGERNAAAELAYVCERLDELSAVLPGGVEAAPVRRLREAVRRGEDPALPLDDLHTTLLAAGDHIGIYGSRGIQPAGIDQEDADESVYLCPAHRCSRYDWPEPGVAPPECTLTGQPLRPDGL